MPILAISFQAVNPDVVICDYDEIKAGRDGILSNLMVPFSAIGLGGCACEYCRHIQTWNFVLFSRHHLGRDALSYFLDGRLYLRQ